MKKRFERSTAGWGEMEKKVKKVREKSIRVGEE